jgi:flagellar biogenesis protein FliO
MNAKHFKASLRLICIIALVFALSAWIVSTLQHS